MSVHQRLKEIFGFDQFRNGQQEVVESVLSGRHTVALMPTGSGKSLCYQLPSKMLQGTTLVISPLIALMKDQVDQAQAIGFRAAYINSSLSKAERERRQKNLREYELIYVTPERFQKQEFVESIKTIKVPLLAIDEAHCISQWGHDFRPDFTRVPEFRDLLGDPTTLMLTATATPQVQEDIIQQCGLSKGEVRVVSSGLSRPNLHFSVHEVYGLDEKVRSFVGLRAQHPGPTIVYFSLISTLEKFSAEIHRLGFQPSVYHGQMGPESRRRNQDRFIKGDSDLILATPAFGLGINKSDVRMVIHAEVPGSIESYFQEAGRAGRDGKPSRCSLLYDQDDVRIQEEFMKWANPEPEFIRSLFSFISDNQLRIKQAGLDELREQMNFYNRRDFRVETSINLLKRWGALMESELNDFTVIGDIDPKLLDHSLHSERIKADRMRLLEMVRYATKQVCRVQQIHFYFGDKEQKECGQCDVCVKNCPT